jgi:hypothetical protein
VEARLVVREAVTPYLLVLAGVTATSSGSGTMGVAAAGATTQAMAVPRGGMRRRRPHKDLGKDKALVAPVSGSRSSQLQQQQRIERKSSPSDVSCLNCGSNENFSARCPTIRCERCGKLGHINQICQAVFALGMCGFYVWFSATWSRFLLLS